VNNDPDPSGSILYNNVYQQAEAPSGNRRGFAITTSQLNFSTPQLLNFFFLAMAVLLLQGCQPDLQVIEDITRVDETPAESTFNIEIIYSSGGIVRMIMTSPRMDRYETEKPYLEMPEGLEVLFYDSLMNVTSSMSAKYAISYGDNELVEARNDVVVVNELNERLNTEHLVWDQKKEIIFSDNFVKITREDEVLYGDGFESDERFNQWVIKKPRGTFTIDTEPQSNAEGI
jgi:LPS export ABC transporter protein LptC